MAKRGRPPHPEVLTPREWEVLDLLRRGLTNAQIAEQLGITMDGAKYHVSEILGKLGVESRQEAATWTPASRPWWAATLAPFGRLAESFAIKAGASAVIATGLAGLGALIWFVLAADGRPKAFDLFPGVYVLDVKSGKYTRLIDRTAVREYGQGGRSIAWSPDGKWLATWGSSGRRLTLVDPESGTSRETATTDLNRADGEPEWLLDGRLSTGQRILDPSSLSIVWTPSEDLRYASDLSWSPDGKFLAYVWSLVPLAEQAVGRPPGAPPLEPVPWRERPVGLYLIDAAGTETLLETGLFQKPEWSPDGRRLAVAGYQRKDRLPGDDSATGVYTLDGSRPPASLPFSNDMAWSPDGKILALVVREDVVVIAADGSSAPEYVALGQRPAWSPDGSKLAYLRDGQLWQSDLATRKEKSLVETPLPLIAEAEWSPDGGKIAFRVGAKASAVYTINVDGSDELYLIPGDRPRWSPDGSRIGFLLGGGAEGGGGYIYSMSPNLTGFVRPGHMWETDVAPGPCGGGMSFEWSRDGSHIAYSTYADGGYEVWVSSLDGHSQVIGKGSHPSWSPDSQHLAINGPALRGPSAPYPGCRSEVVEVKSGSRTIGVEGASLPRWSPDGKDIAATDMRPGERVEIFPEGYFVPIEARAVVRSIGNGKLVDLGPGYAGIWSPDGRWLAYLLQGKLLVSRADGSSEARIIDDRKIFDQSWSPDGQWLTYTAQDEPGQFAIYVAAADGSTPPRRLASGWHPAWSPDGNRIAFSR